MDPTLCFTQTIESESKVAQDYLASEKHKNVPAPNSPPTPRVGHLMDKTNKQKGRN